MKIKKAVGWVIISLMSILLVCIIGLFVFVLYDLVNLGMTGRIDSHTEPLEERIEALERRIEILEQPSAGSE